MANKEVFGRDHGLRRADGVSHEGGAAYRRSDAQALAQLAATGCLNQTFYLGAEEQLEELLMLAGEAEPEFLAQTAIWCRREGYMKDTPAVLAAVLSIREPALFRQVFGRVVDNGKMLRNFVQVMRSGAVGRTSLGTAPKSMVQSWLNTASDKALLAASVGQDPNLADVIRMVHPKAEDERRNAFFAWLIGRPCDVELLPQSVQDWLAMKAGVKGRPVPDVPFQMLASLPLTTRHWIKIAERGGWQMVRMNLNTFQRHGVFENRKMVARIAAKLRDADEIARARVFPYQLLAAWKHADPALPVEIREALQDAMEIAVGNVPKLPGVVAVCPDVSGSMSWATTGARLGATSKVRCIDVAGLMAAAVLRKNRQAYVLPFEQDVVDIRLNPRDTVVTNAEALASIGGGGTACSAPLARLNAMRARVDTVILVSDNESWADRRSGWGRGTAMMKEWETLKRRNKGAKLICIDITPNVTVQAYERRDVLNVGGFSDRVFDLIAAFANDRLDPDHWVGEIEKVRL